MRPTAAGLSLADRARRALPELDRARAELAVTPGGVVQSGHGWTILSGAGIAGDPAAKEPRDGEGRGTTAHRLTWVRHNSV
jgi:hypothetical protein